MSGSAGCPGGCAASSEEATCWRPGPPDLALQYIDCRDLARWLLHAADEGITGAFNTVSQPGHATMAGLLEAAVEVTGSTAGSSGPRPS